MPKEHVIEKYYSSLKITNHMCMSCISLCKKQFCKPKKQHTVNVIIFPLPPLKLITFFIRLIPFWMKTFFNFYVNELFQSCNWSDVINFLSFPSRENKVQLFYKICLYKGCTAHEARLRHWCPPNKIRIWGLDDQLVKFSTQQITSVHPTTCIAFFPDATTWHNIFILLQGKVKKKLTIAIMLQWTYFQCQATCTISNIWTAQKCLPC